VLLEEQPHGACGGVRVMNEAKQKVKGVGEQIKGKAREVGGKMTGNTSEQLRGKYEQAKGKTRSAVADMAQNFEDETDTEI